MSEYYDDFSWHSSTGINKKDSKSNSLSRLANNDKNLEMFKVATIESKLLIHKATGKLWRFSEDGAVIEPVFDSDVLSCEDLENLK